MVTDNHYRWDFIGLSTDTKPTPTTSPKVVNGSTYYCSDNSKLYVWYKDQWYERKPLGGGGGGGSYTAGSGIDITDDTISVDTTVIQPLLTAGSNITISDNTISATNTTYTAGSNVSISDQNVISATDTTYSNFTGTDGTAAGVAGLVPAPATTDAGKFLKADGTWDTAGGGSSYTAGDGIDITNSVISATNTGKAKVLTTDDYNWPTANPNGFALWKMEAGLYTLDKDATTEMHPNYYVGRDNYNNTVSGVDWSSYQGFILTPYRNGSSVGNIATFFSDSGTASFPSYVYSPTVYKAPVTVLDNLTSTSTTSALSAKQGKVLKDLVDSLAFKNAGAPTTATVGTVGQLLEDTTNGKLYICTDTTGGTYTWVEVGAGGSGPTVVQTTGTSTTDVMSQNATTSMVFADPDNKTKVQIGGTAIGLRSVAIGTNTQTATNNSYDSVAIGRSARSSHGGSVALGAFSDTSAVGEVNIGTSSTSYGYTGNSNYRLLTGLYDPQSAHDAATKGYVDPTTDSSAPTTATVGRLGQIFIDTTNADAYMCVAVDSVTPSYTWKKINA